MVIKEKYNMTQLDPEAVFERHVYHRDQFAHYLRWTHILKVIAPKATVLDVGCGSANMLQVLYHNRHVPDLYMGIDVRKQMIAINVEKYAHLKWAKFMALDFCQENVRSLGTFEYITCFEVLEHIGKENAPQFLANLCKQMDKSTHLFVSTPCYNGIDVADNHVINGQVGEFTFDEMKALLKEFFNIVNVWGTFASQKDYYEHMSKADQITFKELSQYYDSNLVSVLFAPLYAEYSRNCIWEVQLR
jgi:2-polyprenyl-3-methyl-5-hydroxy-6-metoxy-1,4-benzoquinol methylase